MRRRRRRPGKPLNWLRYSPPDRVAIPLADLPEPWQEFFTEPARLFREGFGYGPDAPITVDLPANYLDADTPFQATLYGDIRPVTPNP